MTERRSFRWTAAGVVVAVFFGGALLLDSDFPRIMGLVFIALSCTGATWLAFDYGGRRKWLLVPLIVVFLAVMVVAVVASDPVEFDVEYGETVGVTTEYAEERGLELTPREINALYLVLPSVRITNRRGPVALTATLTTRWEGGETTEDQPVRQPISMDNWNPSDARLPMAPPLRREHERFLFPLNLGAGESVQGWISFLITEFELSDHGGLDGVEHHVLAIKDEVSGETSIFEWDGSLGSSYCVRSDLTGGQCSFSMSPARQGLGERSW